MSKNSAVVVLHEQATNSLVLTQRSMHLREHPGEICFPGGRWEAGDTDLWSTALRELQEELGINPERVRLLKELAPEHTLRGHKIYPWLATISRLDPYTANENEVTSVLTIPMNEVITHSNYKRVVVTRYGFSVVTSQFTASDHFVWGATARIMKQLCITKG